MTSDSRTRLIGSAFERLLPVLILLTPYLIFLSENRYSIDVAAPWVMAGIVILVSIALSIATWVGGTIFRMLLITGCVIFFIDVQGTWIEDKIWAGSIFLGLVLLAGLLKENYYKILSVVFGVFFLVTIAKFAIAYTGENRENLAFIHSDTGNHLSRPLRVIHLILDEHIGVEGIPTHIKGFEDERKHVMEFYKKYGFLVYGGGYSHYSKTADSIPSMLNNAAPNTQQAFVEKRDTSWVVKRNLYFNEIRKRGYRIEVWQSKYLVFCGDNTAGVEYCNQYNHWGAKVLDDFGFHIADQVKFIIAPLLGRSYIYRKLKFVVYRQIQKIAANHGIFLPNWSRDALPKTSPLNSFIALDAIGTRIESLPSGYYLFAHLIFPHGPFAFDAECTVNKDYNAWEVKSYQGSEVRRYARYKLYLGQLSCLYKKLDQIFSVMREKGIYKDSLIFLHGDHGSRISIHKPITSDSGQLYLSDLLDNFSTLIAFKGPGESEFRLDTSSVAIQTILYDLVLTYLDTGEIKKLPEARPFVYIRNKRPDKRSLTEMPFPQFGVKYNVYGEVNGR